MKKTRLFPILLVLLLTLSLASCTNPTEPTAETTAPVADSPAQTTAAPLDSVPPESSEGSPDDSTSEEADTTPTFTASPSLDRIEDIPDVGIQCGNTILAGVKYRIGGVIYCGKNENGTLNLGPVEEESFGRWRPMAPGQDIPETFPILVTSDASAIKTVNRTAFPVISDRYQNYQTGDILPENTAPTESGIYIREITVKEPVPTESDPEPEIDTIFGEWIYYFLIVIE